MNFSCTAYDGVPGAIPNEAIVYFFDSYDAEAGGYKNVIHAGDTSDEIGDETYQSLKQIADDASLTRKLGQKLCDRVSHCQGNILTTDPTAAPQCWALGALGLQAAAAEVISD